MEVIEIYKKNEATLLVQASDMVLREIKNYFSVFATNYQFTPLYKEKIWDGKIKFFNSLDNSLPIGLLEKLYVFASIGKYKIEVNFERENEISKTEFKKFVDSLKLPFECRDYQFEAAYQSCVKKNLNIHISTAGGKSLVAYIICRFMETQNIQTLLVVPNQSLVEQMYADFEDYGWDVEYKCHRLYSGQRKIYERQVIIACWQSMYKNTKLLQQFGCLVVDECFIKGTKISTPLGEKNIEDLKINDEVYSYNIDTNKKELKKITKTYKNATISKKLIKIELDNGKYITCTPNHNFFINYKGTIKTKEAYLLNKNDDIISY